MAGPVGRGNRRIEILASVQAPLCGLRHDGCECDRLGSEIRPYRPGPLRRQLEHGRPQHALQIGRERWNPGIMQRGSAPARCWFVGLPIVAEGSLHVRGRQIASVNRSWPGLVPTLRSQQTVTPTWLRRSFRSKLPRRSRWLFVLAGALYVGGALGVEALSGRQEWLHGGHTAGYHAVITVEELLEMAGLVVFIFALLDYIGRRFRLVCIHLSGPPADSETDR